jgi:DNA-binding LytR/AlgR family response regulator
MTLDFSNQKDKKIQINERNKTTLIDVESITYLECDGYVTTIRTINNKTVATSKLLKHFERELEQYGGFTRVNRNSIVNIRHIICVQNIAGRKIIEINGSKIEISHRKSSLFKIT